MGFLSKFPCCLAHVAFNKDVSFCSQGGSAQQVFHPLASWRCTSAAGCGHLLPLPLVSSHHFLRFQELNVVRRGQSLTSAFDPAGGDTEKAAWALPAALHGATPCSASYRGATPRPRPASRHVGTLSPALTNGVGPRSCRWPMGEQGGAGLCGAVRPWWRWGGASLCFALPPVALRCLSCVALRRSASSCSVSSCSASLRSPSRCSVLHCCSADG